MIFVEFLKVSFNFFSLPSLMYLVSYVFYFAFVSTVVLCGVAAMYCGSLWRGLFGWVLFVYLFV